MDQPHQFCFGYYFSKIGFTACVTNEKIIDQSNHDFEQNPYVLHVTAASVYGTKNLHETMTFLSNQFTKRNNFDNDIWLIGVDVLEEEGDTKKLSVITYALLFIHK